MNSPKNKTLAYSGLIRPLLEVIYSFIYLFFNLCSNNMGSLHRIKLRMQNNCKLRMQNEFLRNAGASLNA